MLVHKMITLCKDTVTQGRDIQDINVSAAMVDKYIFLLRFYCFKEVGKYDTQYYYDMPKCMMQGCVESAKNIVKHHLLYEHFNRKREYGVGERFLPKKRKEDIVGKDK